MACEQTVSQILVSITTVDRRRLVDARRGQPTISQPPWSLLEAGRPRWVFAMVFGGNAGDGNGGKWPGTGRVALASIGWPEVLP
jgi:hypothetical protein